MALNEQMNNRIREALEDVSRVQEKRMFRGIAFIVNGKLCLSAGNDELMCRIDPELHDEAVQRPGVRSLVMKGRELKGYIYVHEDVIRSRRDFDSWINLALDFNKRVKASSRKKKIVAKKAGPKPAKKTAAKSARKVAKKTTRKKKS